MQRDSKSFTLAPPGDFCAPKFCLFDFIVGITGFWRERSSMQTYKRYHTGYGEHSKTSRWLHFFNGSERCWWFHIFDRSRFTGFLVYTGAQIFFPCSSVPPSCCTKPANSQKFLHKGTLFKPDPGLRHGLRRFFLTAEVPTPILRRKFHPTLCTVVNVEQPV